MGTGYEPIGFLAEKLWMGEAKGHLPKVSYLVSGFYTHRRMIRVPVNKLQMNTDLNRKEIIWQNHFF